MNLQQLHKRALNTSSSLGLFNKNLPMKQSLTSFNKKSIEPSKSHLSDLTMKDHQIKYLLKNKEQHLQKLQNHNILILNKSNDKLIQLSKLKY
jgi:hypothetical protein